MRKSEVVVVESKVWSTSIEGHVPNLATALHYRRVESLQPNDTGSLVLAVAYLTFEGKMRGEEDQITREWKLFVI